MKFLKFLLWYVLPVLSGVQAVAQYESFYVQEDSLVFQDIVTYDNQSLMIYGQRMFIFSGEFHPFRLPVPELWLDIFQKIKAMGYNTVSFYLDMALLNGEVGVVRMDGIFDLERFLNMAKEAGLYLIARPGPYINGEASGGGYPGWFQRISGRVRTNDESYMEATRLYIATVGAAIAKAQITNGGPVILVQPENEYSWKNVRLSDDPFPDRTYISRVQGYFRDAGIVVPFIGNDVSSQGGVLAPGTSTNGSTLGDWDIYGYDTYPLGFNCSQPTVWPDGDLLTNLYARHELLAPLSLQAETEFQGGCPDDWNGYGFQQCAEMLNQEFGRVFYKNNYAANVVLMNGGTNWGGIAWPRGYTSYDYAAAIAEDRTLTREIYSELKLQAHLMKLAPTYLTSSVQNLSTGVYTDSSDITVTPLLGTNLEPSTNFYIIRHTEYAAIEAVPYRLVLPTSQGTVHIPQLGGTLTLTRRDSKWHMTNYQAGDFHLLYATAEIFTWRKFEDRTVLVVYGGIDETHEIAVTIDGAAELLEGSNLRFNATDDAVILHWTTSSQRQVVRVSSKTSDDKLDVYILDRNSAYNYWVPDFEDKTGVWQRFSANIENTTSLIVQAGYLIRSVNLENNNLYVNGDVNATVPFKLIGVPKEAKSFFFNGKKLNFTVDKITGDWEGSLEYEEPAELEIPNLDTLEWKYVDNLPEIKSTYDDSLWTLADITSTNNTRRNLTTPTTLYASDYGYNVGVLIYRGHFIATGNETTMAIETQGGSAFGTSLWLNETYLGSWKGDIGSLSKYWMGMNSTFSVGPLKPSASYVFTMLVMNQGLEEDPSAGGEYMKMPRGILDFDLSGRNKSSITWKLTGNFLGEKYPDKARGPLNEGGLFAERQGWTQPNPPNQDWVTSKPTTGIDKPGVGFWQTSFDLNLPKGYDIPLSFNIVPSYMANGSLSLYRATLWVNGYQMGRYINHLGPQTNFPVHQGILDYHGTNSLAVEIWAQHEEGAKLANFTLEAGKPVLTSMETPKNVPMPAYSPRKGVY
ncbi:beta-galactosidase-1 [Coleophoma crateriformis]|uniref:Beta-galactosidase n=1 Tax=Coleophoma crateriformis TaxID=565419 RepID=A0A3D8QUH6_9HELO|nr:beta-galactosidase-1 [Coleophoma crateriformis]